MEIAVPVIPADDIGIAKQFYEKLGFNVTFETRGGDGKTGMIGVKRGSMEIVIDAPMSGLSGSSAGG